MQCQRKFRKISENTDTGNESYELQAPIPGFHCTEQVIAQTSTKNTNDTKIATNIMENKQHKITDILGGVPQFIVQNNLG